MKKLLLSLVALVAALAVNAEVTVLSTPSASVATLTDANGIITIADATEATGIQVGTVSLPYDGNQYTGMKLSGKRQFTLSYASGVTINSVTIICVDNKADGTTYSLGTTSARNELGAIAPKGSTTPTTFDITTATGLNCGAQFNAIIVVDYTVAGPALESITITGNMTKTAYYSDEDADFAGLGVEGTYDNDSTAAITAGINWSIAPSFAVGTTDYVVTAKVGELTATKNVTLSVSVRPLPDPADAELTTDGYLLLDYEHATTAPNGIFMLGTTAIKQVAIHTNKDKVFCIQFANGYTDKDSNNESYYTGNVIKLAILGGFKAGDVITIAGFFNNSDSTKVSKAVVFTKEDEENDTEDISVLYTTDQFINGRLVSSEPNVFTYTLEADAEVLYIGRNGNTGTNIYTLKVVRPVAEEPVYDFAAVISGGSLETPLNIELTEGENGLEGSYSGYLRVGTYSIVFADNSSSAPARAAEDAQTFTLDDNGMYDLAISYDGSSFTVTPTFNGYATAIENTEAQKVEKKMINGQLVIIKNGVEYSVLGARL